MLYSINMIWSIFMLCICLDIVWILEVLTFLSLVLTFLVKFSEGTEKH